MHLSGWAVLQHAGIGILLGAAIVLGNRRRGRRRRLPVRVRAVPRARTRSSPTRCRPTILPELTLDAKRNDNAGVRAAACAGRSTAWRSSWSRSSAAFVALAGPGDAGDHRRQPARQRRAPRRRDRLARDRPASRTASSSCSPGRSTRCGDSRTPGGHRARHRVPRRRVHDGRRRHVDPRHRPGPRARLRPQPGLPARRARARRRARPPAPRSRSSRARCRSPLLASVVLGVAAWALFQAHRDRRAGSSTIALLVGVGVVGAAIYFGVLRLVRGQGVPTLRASAVEPGRQREARPPRQLSREPLVRLAEPLGQLGAHVVARSGCPRRWPLIRK